MISPSIMHHKNRKGGFTLIELVLFMGLMSILLMVIIDVFNTVLTVQLDSEKTTYTATDSRYIYTRLLYDIHRAKSINLPASLGTSGSSLQLTIFEGGADRTFTYTVNSTTHMLTLTNYLGTIELNSPNTTISGLSFTRLGNVNGKNSVQLSFTTTSVAKSRSINEVQTYQTTIGLR